MTVTLDAATSARTVPASARLTAALEQLASALDALEVVEDLPAEDVAEDTWEQATRTLRCSLLRLQAVDAAVLGRFAATGAWGRDGFRTLRSWLRATTRAGEAEISRRCDLGRLMGDHPELAGRFRRGRVGEDHLRALGSVWSAAPTVRPALEAAAEVIADYAERSTPRELTRFLTELALRVDPDAQDAADERALRERAGLRLTVHDDGWVRVTGLLPPDLGIRLVAVLDAASAPAPPQPTTPEPATPEPAAPEPAASPPAAEPAPPEPAPRPIRLLEALGRVLDLAEAGAAEGSRALGSNGSRPVVHLTLDAATFLADPSSSEGSGHARSAVTGPGGTGLTRGCVPVSSHTAARLSCDAVVRRLVLDPAGLVLDVGRATRTIPTGTRIAVEHRDRHCRWPGCDQTIREIHHVVHWARGGGTSPANCVGLCWWHHRQVHEGGWSLSGDADRMLELRHRDPDRLLRSGPPQPDCVRAALAASPLAP